MHPAQKQAVLAMLASIQQQILQVQGLLGFEASQPSVPSQVEASKAPAQTEYLTEDEENKIDAVLEQARVDGLAEAEQISKAWKRQQAEFHGTGVAF